MSDKIRDAVLELKKLNGDCSYCNGVWGNHGLVNGKACPGEKINKAIDDISQVVESGALPCCCPICGRYGCMNDHGYGGPGPED